MLEVYKNLYKMGLMSASDIEDMVIYMPIFGFKPLDYEEITDQPWPDKKENK